MKIVRADYPKLDLSPGEREIFIKAGEKFDILNNEDKENIELLIKKTIESVKEISIPFQSLESLVDSLQIYLEHNEAAVLVNLILNTRNLNNFLNQLKDEKVFSGKSYPFIKKMSAHYGLALRDIVRLVQQPYDWIRIESDVLIANDAIMLQNYLIRGDNQQFLFNIPFRDIATFSEHFIKRTLEGCQKIDKENILEVEEKSLNKLVKSVNELKELYDKIKNETSLELEK